MIDRALVAEAEVESTTLKVGVLVPAAVGVPEMMPVVLLRLNPAGRFPVKDQVQGSIPPLSARVCE